MYNVFMEGLQFVWDERKNNSNKRKYGVSFQEAQTAFYDEKARVYHDPDHSEEEDRFIIRLTPEDSSLMIPFLKRSPRKQG